MNVPIAFDLKRNGYYYTQALPDLPEICHSFHIGIATEILLPDYSATCYQLLLMTSDRTFA
jgi:hypothetical protein